jgi:hypothetical protein
MVWGDADMLNVYLQTVDWLQGVNNGGALFIKGMSAICMGRPDGAALIGRAEEEGDLQAAYVLAVLKYYKHDTIDDVFIHIRCMYGEGTFGSQDVGGRRTGTTTRMKHVLPEFTTESQRG